MSESISPALKAAPPAPERNAGMPSLAFADAEGVAQWAKMLPLTNVAQVYDAVLGQLRAARGAALAVAGAARVLSARRDARVRGHRGVRQPDPQRRGHLVLLDLQPRAAARARRSVRDDGEADRAHRPLARDVGAQGVSVRRAARERGTRDRGGPRRQLARDARLDDAAQRPTVDALRLSRQARDQRARPAQAIADRRESRGAAARP